VQELEDGAQWHNDLQAESRYVLQPPLNRRGQKTRCHSTHTQGNKRPLVGYHPRRIFFAPKRDKPIRHPLEQQKNTNAQHHRRASVNTDNRTMQETDKGHLRTSHRQILQDKTNRRGTTRTD